MGLYTVKQALKNYINSQIFIENWGLVTPINIPRIIDGVYYPSSAGVIIPASDYTMASESIHIVNSEATFGADLCWRFNGEASFTELPLEIIENLIDWVSHHPVCRPGLFSALAYDVSVVNTANPVLMSRTDSEDRDWLVYGFLRWQVAFRSTPIDPNDLGIVQPDIDRPNSLVVTSVGITTYADYLKPVNNPTLDKEIIQQ